MNAELEYAESGNSPPRRNFFAKARKPATTPTATHSEARQKKGTTVHRKRFQKGSVYMNANKTMWLGAYSEYVLDGHGVEQRVAGGERCGQTQGRPLQARGEGTISKSRM